MNFHPGAEDRVEIIPGRTHLSGILTKSGPLDFATKNSFPLFFVCEKGLVHNSLILLCYKPKTNFARNGVSGGDRKAKICGF